MRKLAIAVILAFFVQILAIVLPSTSHGASTTYRYQGYTYTRISITFSVKISFVPRSKSRSVECTQTQPRNVTAQPGAIGTKSVLVRWNTPACGKPSEGYQIALISGGDYDADDIDNRTIRPKGLTSYLKVDSSKTAVMVEGVNFAESFNVVVGAIGNGQVSESAEVSTRASSANISSASTSPIISINEETNINGDPKSSGIRVSWERSSGKVKYYVLQYSEVPNPNNCLGHDCDLFYDEKYVPPTQTEAIISRYKVGEYRVRVKSVGENGSVAFSPYAHVKTGRDNSNISADLYGSNNRFVQAGLIPKISYVSTDQMENSHSLRMSNYDPNFLYVFTRYIHDQKPTLDSSGIITIPNYASCTEKGFILIVKRKGYATTVNDVRFQPECRALPNPTFGPIKSNSTGFQFQITNHDPNLTYDVSGHWECGCRTTKSETGLVTVEGMADDGSAGVSRRMTTEVYVVVTYPSKAFLSSKGFVTGSITYDAPFVVSELRKINGQDSQKCVREGFCTGSGVGFHIKNYKADASNTWYISILDSSRKNYIFGRAFFNDYTGEGEVFPLVADEKVYLEIMVSKQGRNVFKHSILVNGANFS